MTNMRLTYADFWGPASNFGIPVAAVMDTQKDPDIISGRMTTALLLYSGTFMRYALAISPKNYLLFACHFVNFGAQSTQGYRYLQYWNFGGKEAALQDKAKSEAKKIGADGKEMAEETKEGAQGIVDQAKAKAGELKAKVVK
ncbi:hypothetical protein OEA41_000460 [Lepraria neglecta]|uniref:Mitochondrial pyruvate carrier n=1 Tax=Lepraria neglecta TaxID=209136 RepID=A0AAD9ZIZ1_9LECA|nr:hypothetical protein OEA41_000460 [Lepraria neglecta]